MRKFSLREKVLSGCVVFLLIAFAIVAVRAVRTESQSQGWLQSQAAIIKLGVWDKGGEYENGYEATFIVTAPNGKKTTAKAKAEGDDWVYVNFPEAFDNYDAINYSKLTTYKWRCLVKGKEVASGTFQWSGTTSVAQ